MAKKKGSKGTTLIMLEVKIESGGHGLTGKSLVGERWHCR